MTPTELEGALAEVQALVAPHIVGQKHVRVRVVTVRRILSAFREQREALEALIKLKDKFDGSDWGHTDAYNTLVKGKGPVWHRARLALHPEGEG